MMLKHAQEPFIASLGIMAFGWLSIPVVGHFAGVRISVEQGAVMSLCFFILRFAWLYALRRYFENKERRSIGQERKAEEWQSQQQR